MFNYKMSKEQELTVELIKKIINKHKQNDVPKMVKMDKYYHAKNAILNRQMADDTKPNNKVAHPYASYITDTLTGYFMGEGITYSSLDEAAAEELNLILEYNDAADEDMELAKDMSIYGLAVELQYIDEDGTNRIKKLDPKEVVLIYDDTLDCELLYGIRYYEGIDLLTDKKYYNIEVYTDKEIISYKADELLGSLTFVGSTQHYFGMVPISVFFNNEEEIGDFEPVISLIDAYDSLESDSLNDFEYFVDAYLCLTGLTADADDVRAMKENRVLLLDSDSDAKWLTKNVSDTNVENIKDRIDADIHKFAKVPDMSDEAFSGNSSGVAIKYKTMPMENVVAIKERKFKKGIQRRIEMMFNILALKGTNYDWRGIDISFTRNLPTNDTEIASMVSTLSGIVSNETLLAQVPFVTNVQSELEKVQKENKANPFLDYKIGLNGEDEDERAQEKEEEQL